jgi:hypothetical protein
MEIAFFKEEDIAEVNSWRKARGCASVDDESFPKIGFIIHEVAAVFVYLTDSNIAMVEGLISNPSAGIMERGHGIKKLVNMAQAAAENMRERVVVIIENDGVSKLALGLGFKSIGKCELFIKG